MTPLGNQGHPNHHIFLHVQQDLHISQYLATGRWNKTKTQHWESRPKLSWNLSSATLLFCHVSHAGPRQVSSWFPNLETKPCLKISAEKQRMQKPLVPVKAFTPPAASLREDVPCGCCTPGCLRLQVEKTREQMRKEISPFILPTVPFWTLLYPSFSGLWFCLFVCVHKSPEKSFSFGFSIFMSLRFAYSYLLGFRFVR